MDEYEEAIQSDEDVDTDDAALEHAALMKSLRPISAKQPPSAGVARRPPSATSDVAMGQTSATTVVRGAAVLAPPHSARRSRPISAKVPAPPQAATGTGASRPVSARYAGNSGAKTSLSAYGFMSHANTDVTAQVPATLRSATLSTDRAAALHERTFTGVKQAEAEYHHSPTRPKSLAFRPTLSRLTQHVVDDNAKYRFDTTFHLESNPEAVLKAHRDLSLRPPADEATDPRDLSVVGRYEKRVDSARRLRSSLEERIAVNVPNWALPGTRENFMASVASDACGRAAIAADGGGVSPTLLQLRQRLGFRTVWRQPRNDDLRLAYVREKSLGLHQTPFVPPDKVFSCRLADAAVNAAFEDAALVADAAKPAHESRPHTPRSVDQFFNRGATMLADGVAALNSSGRYDAASFEAQDDVYREEMRAAVRAAVERNSGGRTMQPARTGLQHRASGSVTPRTSTAGGPPSPRSTVAPRGPQRFAASSRPTTAGSVVRRADAASRGSAAAPKASNTKHADRTVAAGDDVHTWVQQVVRPLSAKQRQPNL
jgi:hypothetical protein